MICERLKDLYHLINDFYPFVDWLSPKMCFFSKSDDPHETWHFNKICTLFSERITILFEIYNKNSSVFTIVLPVSIVGSFIENYIVLKRKKKGQAFQKKM